MATLNWADVDRCFVYSMRVGNEITTRTIHSLNVGSNNSLGPNNSRLVTGLINTINSLSKSQVINPRYIMELGVYL